MRNTVIFYTLITALILAGVWGIKQTGLLKLVENPLDSNAESSRSSVKENDERSRIDLTQTQNLSEPLLQQGGDTRFERIQTLIRDGHSRQAAAAINQAYSNLSRDDLERLKQEFLAHAARASDEQAKRALIAASAVFDDLDVWKHLANVSIKNSDWQLAFDAQLRASELESDSVELNSLLKYLVQSSSYLRAEYERNGDQLSIKALYQRLANLHPQFSRFQLELANSHARLNEYRAAENIYQTLSYDPEFGDIARQALSRIRDANNEQSAVSRAELPVEPQRQSDIVVPLIAAGSSFLIDTTIDRQRSRLLLDTGASITALSSDLIQRLNLKPTGRSIQLSTANGLTRARLYRADSLSLGRLRLRNMVVAEIEMGRRGGFEGLLGTDALNQFKSQYSYIIDNQRNALIFRAR